MTRGEVNGKHIHQWETMWPPDAGGIRDRFNIGVTHACFRCREAVACTNGLGGWMVWEWDYHEQTFVKVEHETQKT